MGLSELRILVVDDNAVIGALIAEILDSLGHDVCGIEATEDGAVRAARAQQPEMMIVDARLGQGSGISAMARILCDGPMPHVYISGGDLSMVEAGAVVVRKPFTAEDLVEAIGKVVSGPVDAGYPTAMTQTDQKDGS